MNEQLQSEIAWCVDVAARARAILPTLPALVQFERAAVFCEGCYLIDTYAQQAAGAEGVTLAQLTIRLGVIAGKLDQLISELTLQSKRRASRNKSLKHQGKRLQTAERFDELRKEHGRNNTLQLLAEEMGLLSERQVENRLSSGLPADEQTSLDSLQAEPWFPEFLEHMDRCIPELLAKAKDEADASKKS